MAVNFSYGGNDYSTIENSTEKTTSFFNNCDTDTDRCVTVTPNKVGSAKVVTKKLHISRMY